MTDKDIKDYCKNCDVEPPAMRFKCPECEHNPNNENNFAKDINAPHKEQIIIDGVDVSRCTYVVCKATCKNTDCYYKLLQRKTAECEKYEQALDEISELANENKNTSQYRGICQSILNIINKAKEEG